jgi:hypothetical protein
MTTRNDDEHDEDSMVTLMSSLTMALDRTWPLDIIGIITMYARNRSLVVIGGLAGLFPIPYCMIITPASVYHGYQTKWYILPESPKDMLQSVGFRWCCNNELVCCHYDAHGEAAVSLTLGYRTSYYHLRTPINITASSSSSPSPIKALNVDGVTFNEWHTHRKPSLPSYMPHLNVGMCLAYRNIIYQFDGLHASFLDVTSTSTALLHDNTSKVTDPITNVDNNQQSWQAIADMPIESLTSINVWRDQIYLMGRTGLHEAPLMVSLSPVSHKWYQYPHFGGLQRTRQPLTLSIDHIGILYLFGDGKLGDPRPNIEVWQPKLDRWTFAPFDLPFVNDALMEIFVRWTYVDGYICMAGLGNRDIWAIYIGWSEEEFNNVTTDQWFKLPNYPFHDHFRAPSLFAL